MSAPAAFYPVFIACAALSWLGYSCATQGAASAEEYYSIGMAYFDFGKYEEAEKWLNRARSLDKTKNASEYNLGRIAYETGRYAEALQYFNRILSKDPENVLALKAAAYTYIKTGDLAKAGDFYKKVLDLVPESADNGFNYALVLFALKKPAEAEAALQKYQLTLEDRDDSLLLLARVQAAQNKVEAVDTYHAWLLHNEDHKVRYEYAQVLEAGEFYTRALEEYRELLSALQDQGNTQTQDKSKKGAPQASRVRFDIARLLMIADPKSEEGLNELTQAVKDGFSDAQALEALDQDERLSAAHRQEIRRILNTVKTTAKPADEEAKDRQSDDEPAREASEEAKPGPLEGQSAAPPAP
ncbi:MAG: tetratricopeptide repeat protein [Treponema sp.]|jgi:tetratricopeptide (TPR) repeat protein|nr:tetratricopeptide repeat protein [Treponema sp.]